MCLFLSCGQGGRRRLHRVLGPSCKTCAPDHPVGPLGPRRRQQVGARVRGRGETGAPKHLRKKTVGLGSGSRLASEGSQPGRGPRGRRRSGARHRQQRRQFGRKPAKPRIQRRRLARNERRRRKRGVGVGRPEHIQQGIGKTGPGNRRVDRKRRRNPLETSHRSSTSLHRKAVGERIAAKRRGIGVEIVPGSQQPPKVGQKGVRIDAMRRIRAKNERHKTQSEDANEGRPGNLPQPAHVVGKSGRRPQQTNLGKLGFGGGGHLLEPREHPEEVTAELDVERAAVSRGREPIQPLGDQNARKDGAVQLGRADAHAGRGPPMGDIMRAKQATQKGSRRPRRKLVGKHPGEVVNRPIGRGSPEFGGSERGPAGARVAERRKTVARKLGGVVQRRQRHPSVRQARVVGHGSKVHPARPTRDCRPRVGSAGSLGVCSPLRRRNAVGVARSARLDRPGKDDGAPRRLDPAARGNGHRTRARNKGPAVGRTGV